MKAAAIILAVISGFTTVVTGFTVNCTFGTGTYAGINAVYQCYARISPESSNPTVTNVIGTHATGMTNEDVKFVYIHGNYLLSFVPRGFTSFFPNLIGLNLHYTTFEALNGDELDNLGEKLTWFGVAYSNLTTISSQLFDSTPNIANVFLSHNRIQRVGRYLFAAVDVTQLRYVFFYDNRCISGGAHELADIVALIGDLQVLCPIDGEVLRTTTSTTAATTTTTTTTTTAPTTTTTTPTTTTTTTTTPEPMTTTPAIPTCFDGRIEDFACEINEKVGVVQSDLTSTRDDLQSQLNHTNEKLETTTSELELVKAELETKDQRFIELETNFEAIKDELQWMRDELLRITTNPCACK
jgi:hypothetical protein